MVILSMVVASVLVYRLNYSSREPSGRAWNGVEAQDQSSLNEDLCDILGFIPLDEVNDILQSFVKYDKQIGDVTVGYINDHWMYIAREFKRMPEFQRALSFLANNGLDVEYWRNKIAEFWMDLPAYVNNDTSLACGGLSAMVNKVVRTIPRNEMHEFLCQKLRYSSSFRAFLEMLRSPNFEELCDAIESSKVLQRHYFWANDDGIEVIFAVELLKNLYMYLAYELE
ncbi:uncharacterized protein LOC124404649 [Diprion similis]|uniref:uncharacterized protein LOC124404649 n=1 Tax=Diprion similis TaxID=362088 RepID=UPI001EF7DDE5|nr:uncharacterized protein LOC124404649 [Diprion similis]